MMLALCMPRYSVAFGALSLAPRLAAKRFLSGNSSGQAEIRELVGGKGVVRFAHQVWWKEWCANTRLDAGMVRNTSMARAAERCCSSYSSCDLPRSPPQAHVHVPWGRLGRLPSTLLLPAN